MVLFGGLTKNQAGRSKVTARGRAEEDSPRNCIGEEGAPTHDCLRQQYLLGASKDFAQHHGSCALRR